MGESNVDRVRGVVDHAETGERTDEAEEVRDGDDDPSYTVGAQCLLEGDGADAYRGGSGVVGHRRPFSLSSRREFYGEAMTLLTETLNSRPGLVVTPGLREDWITGAGR